jgi:hypothetical protein
MQPTRAGQTVTGCIERLISAAHHGPANPSLRDPFWICALQSGILNFELPIRFAALSWLAEHLLP